LKKLRDSVLSTVGMAAQLQNCNSSSLLLCFFDLWVLWIFLFFWLPFVELDEKIVKRDF